MNGSAAATDPGASLLTGRGYLAVGAACAAVGILAAFADAPGAFGLALLPLLLLAVVWVVRSPARALCVYAFMLPLDVYLSTTLRVTSTQVLQVVVFAGWMGQLLLSADEPRPQRRVLPYRLGAAFVAYLVASIAWSPNPDASARTVARILGAIVMAVYAAEHADRDTLGRITRAMCYGALVTAAYGFAQYLRGGYDALYPYFSPFYTDLWQSRGGGFAVVATFANPNILAGYLLMVLPLSWAAWDAASGVRRSAWAIASLALGLVLLLTFSKASWLLVGVLVALWLVVRVPVGLSLTAGAAAGVALGVGLLLLEPILRTLFVLFPDSREASVDTRLALWWAALNVFLEHPLLGFGPDGFAAATGEMRVGVLANLTRAHNMYLQALVDHGIVGSALLWGTCAFILRRAVQASRVPRPRVEAARHTGLLLAAAAFFLYGLVETLNVSNQYVNTVWLVLGLLAASSRNAELYGGARG